MYSLCIPTKILYIFLMSGTRVPCVARLTSLHYIALIIFDEVQIMEVFSF
jgi:hypothetical protein